MCGVGVRGCGAWCGAQYASAVSWWCDARLRCVVRDPPGPAAPARSSNTHERARRPANGLRGMGSLMTSLLRLIDEYWLRPANGFVGPAIGGGALGSGSVSSGLTCAQ